MNVTVRALWIAVFIATRTVRIKLSIRRGVPLSMQVF